MSFRDLGPSKSPKGKQTQRRPTREPAYEGEYQRTGNDLERERLRQEITSNLGVMDKKCNETRKELKKIGTKKDTEHLREVLQTLSTEQHTLREATHHMITSFKEASGGGTPQVEKLVKDLFAICSKAKEVAKETQVKYSNHPEPTGGPGGSGGAPGDLLGGDYVAEPASRPLLDAHRQEQQLVDGRLRQNEDEILRRESDARRIETDVADIAEIMQDLAVVVSSHTELIDNIETNVENTVEKTEGANGQLIQAEKYQQGNRKLMCCLFQLLVIVVAGLVLLLIFRKPK
jgi:hypothetical protein